MFLLYIGVLLYVTLFAWNYGASLGPEGPGGRNYNLMPFRSIYRIAVFSPDIRDPIRILLGNVILFIPFGFLMPLVFKPRARSFLKVTALGMMVSISIELYQFLFTYRVANVDDVILNTTGAAVGFCLFYIGHRLKKRIIVIPSNTKKPS
ncbi:VanZ family protein [Desertibacillus haloalkaliphilus]|uniref:VanZ family protein n=1 Tax=Desertibacillus haloalkaliphilus TaxID=1328930 RepID=UPI001FE81658|nr:VanZ family protein [Desertibacillus haloalkaliphilus]